MKSKILSFLDAALKKQIPWIVLETFIDEMIPSLEMMNDCYCIFKLFLSLSDILIYELFAFLKIIKWLNQNQRMMLLQELKL